MCVGDYPGMIPGSTWVTRESRDTWTRRGGDSCLYPGMIPGSTWVTRESWDTWTGGEGGGGGSSLYPGMIPGSTWVTRESWDTWTGGIAISILGLSFLSLSVKIVQSRLLFNDTGKPSFEKVGQMFVDVNETTANVPNILTSVRYEFGA